MTAPEPAVVWSRAAAAVLAKAGRAVPDPDDPAAVGTALSAHDGVDVPALGSTYLTPFRLATPMGGGPDWQYVAENEPNDAWIDGTMAADAGAGVVAELAYLWAAGTAALRAEAPAAGFRIAVDQDFFVSIAKLRALRVGWARIREVSGLPAEPALVHAATAAGMMAGEDVHTNLIRTTIAAAAAVLAGADLLTVLPFDAGTGQSSEFGNRLAQNISRLLAGESFLTRDADPAAGAFALEELTRRLAEAAWAEFQTLDGLLADRLADGSLAAEWAAQGEARAADIAEGRRIVVGVNAFRVAS